MPFRSTWNTSVALFREMAMKEPVAWASVVLGFATTGLLLWRPLVWDTIGAAEPSPIYFGKQRAQPTTKDSVFYFPKYSQYPQTSDKQ